MRTRLRGEINEEAGVMQNSATTLEGEPLYLGVHPPPLDALAHLRCTALHRCNSLFEHMHTVCTL